MRYVTRLSLLVLAVMAVSAVVSATASAALPEFLGKLPAAFTTAGKTAVFELKEGAPSPVTCTSAEGKGSFTAAKEGTFDELFLGCSATVAGLKVKCTGLKDTVEGSILAKGTFKLGVEDKTKVPVAALTIEEVHFECSVALILVKGCVLGKIEPENKSVTEGKLVLAGEKGVQSLTKYETEEKSEKLLECKLLGSFSTSAEHKFVAASQKQTAELKFSEKVEIMA